MNTKRSGSLDFFIFEHKTQKRFLGICYQLGIIKEAEDFKKLKGDLEEAAHGYVKTICAKNLPDSLLNQQPPKMYRDLCKKFLAQTQDNLLTPAPPRRGLRRTRHAMTGEMMFRRTLKAVCRTA